MRNLLIEKSPDTSPEKSPGKTTGNSPEKSGEPVLKTRKPATTVPALSLSGVGTTADNEKAALTNAKTIQASPRIRLKSPQSHFSEHSPRNTSLRSNPNDSIFLTKNANIELFRSPLLPSAQAPDLKKSIQSLSILLIKIIENQLTQSYLIKQEHASDNTQNDTGSQGVLSEQMIKALGRMDHKISVKDLPPELAFLNPNPEKDTVRFEQLLQALFSHMVKDNGIDSLMQLKKMQALLNHGDSKIEVGETDPQIRDQMMRSFQPYANEMAREIYGTDKKLDDCMLPATLIHDFLIPIDHMMLEMALKNPKLSLKSINTARMNFLFDLVITRLLMPLASSDNKIEGIEGKEKWPTQLEIWLQSSIMISFKTEWQNFFKKFIEKSNASLPKNIDDKVNALAADLAKNRIAELQKNNSRHFGSSSTLSPRNVRTNKILLDSIKKEIAFSDLPSDFLKFISVEEKHSPIEKKQGSRLNFLSEFQEKAFEYQAKLDAAGLSEDPEVLKFSKKIKELLTQESKALLSQEQSRPKTTAFDKDDHATLLRDIKSAEESLIKAQLQAKNAMSNGDNSTIRQPILTTLNAPERMSPSRPGPEKKSPVGSSSEKS